MRTWGRGPEHGPAVPRLGGGHVVSGLSGSGENEARPDGRRPSWGAALPSAWAPRAPTMQLEGCQPLRTSRGMGSTSVLTARLATSKGRAGLRGVRPPDLSSPPHVGLSRGLGTIQGARPELPQIPWLLWLLEHSL